MKSQLLDEVIACLPTGKTHYRYYQGAYASRLLSMMLPEKVDLHKLKQTRFKRLLEHKSVKPIVSQCGDGVLDRQLLASSWCEPSQAFLLSVSRWGKNGGRYWNQTSRYGENLVLQLNLPMQNLRHYQRWVDPSCQSTLNGTWSSHPVQTEVGKASFRETLAWARIDLDFETNEALIEEVQSDATRKVLSMSKHYKRCRCSVCSERLKYVNWFEPYLKLWSEALLCAAIEFIRCELGIERIFIHTARSGWQVKKWIKAGMHLVLYTQIYRRSLDFYRLTLRQNFYYKRVAISN